MNSRLEKCRRQPSYLGFIIVLEPKAHLPALHNFVPDILFPEFIFSDKHPVGPSFCSQQHRGESEFCASFLPWIQ